MLTCDGCNKNLSVWDAFFFTLKGGLRRISEPESEADLSLLRNCHLCLSCGEKLMKWSIKLVSDFVGMKIGRHPTPEHLGLITSTFKIQGQEKIPTALKAEVEGDKHA